MPAPDTNTTSVNQLESTRKALQDQIAATEAQLRNLRHELAELDAKEREDAREAFVEQRKEQDTSQSEASPDAGYSPNPCGATNGQDHQDTDDGTAPKSSPSRWPLLQDEYRRYGRQMIVDQIGLEGQLKLRASSVLLVGAGGLGCPAALYLAGAGVGTLGLLDGDTVEPSNLHRQVLHRTRNTGKYKVDSAIEYLQELNPHPRYVPFRKRLTPEEAPDIFDSFDVILDCTDNPATRYLISDTAVLLGKPLVSASALRTDGQLMILNYPARPAGDTSGGPCYRCMFPKPPPADNVVSCADGGILGPVVGLMGVMQALETIRVITTPETPEPHTSPIVPSLHLFSAYTAPPFRSIRLRRRRANCTACSAKASVTLDSLRSGSMDYVQFCGSLNATSLLSPEERVTAEKYAQTYNTASSQQTLLDVRERVQYDICALQNSLNVPISEFLSLSRKLANQANGAQDESKTSQPPWVELLHSLPDNNPIHVVCRQGNDSQAAVRVLKEMGLDKKGKRFVGDIKGGLNAWRRDVDPEFPDY